MFLFGVWMATNPYEWRGSLRQIYRFVSVVGGESELKKESEVNFDQCGVLMEVRLCCLLLFVVVLLFVDVVVIVCCCLLLLLLLLLLMLFLLSLFLLLLIKTLKVERKKDQKRLLLQNLTTDSIQTSSRLHSHLKAVLALPQR